MNTRTINTKTPCCVGLIKLSVPVLMMVYEHKDYSIRSQLQSYRISLWKTRTIIQFLTCVLPLSLGESRCGCLRSRVPLLMTGSVMLYGMVTDSSWSLFWGTSVVFGVVIELLCGVLWSFVDSVGRKDGVVCHGMDCSSLLHRYPEIL